MQAPKYNRQHFPNKIHEYDLEYQQSDLLSLSCHYASHNTTTIVTHTNKKKHIKSSDLVRANGLELIEFLYNCRCQMANVSKRTTSVELVHAAQQAAEFLGDVQSLPADGNAVPKVRRIPRHAARLTQLRDDDRRSGRPADPFQLADERAQTARTGVAA